MVITDSKLSPNASITAEQELTEINRLFRMTSFYDQHVFMLFRLYVCADDDDATWGCEDNEHPCDSF